MRNSLDAWLINALRNELVSGNYTGASQVFAAAKAVIANETARADQWRLEKFARVAQRELAAMAAPSAPNPYMDYLPGLDLSDRLPLRKGEITLGDATWRKVKESIAAIRKEHKEREERRLDTRVGRLKRLLIEMAPYARKNHGLTVVEYCALRASRADGVIAPAKTRAAAVDA